MKVMFGFFSENQSYPASMMGALAQDRGWEVEFGFFSNTSSEAEIAQRLAEARPQVLALSIKTFERYKAFQAARAAHALGIKVIGGGIHATTCASDMVGRPFFDAVVVGDGMGVIGGLLDNHQALQGEQVWGGKHPELWRYTRRIFSPTMRQRIVDSKKLELITGMGCAYSCRFCSTDKKFFAFPLQEVTDQLAAMHADMGFEMVNIMDETFGLSHKRIRKFRQLMERHALPLTYAVQTRVNTFRPAMAEEFVKLGVNDISFGVETASPKLLQALNKRVDPEDNYRAARLCREYGMPVKINLMFGLPFQDEEDYRLTFDYVQEIRPDAIFCHYFVPFPGSELYDYCRLNGYLPADFTFDDYFHTQPGGADIEQVRHRRGILEKIDYDLASHWMQRFIDWDTARKEEVILEVARDVDRAPWVIFGQGEYFHRVLEILSRHQWRNLLGYYNYDAQKYRERNYHITLPEYAWNGAARPETVVITTHQDRSYHTVQLPLLRERFGFHGPVRSVSTYARPVH